MSASLSRRAFLARTAATTGSLVIAAWLPRFARAAAPQDSGPAAASTGLFDKHARGFGEDERQCEECEKTGSAFHDSSTPYAELSRSGNCPWEA